MARMYPTPIGPTDSPAERQLYTLFADQLSDDYAVFHDVSWLTRGRDAHARDGQADFVLAHPDLGICVIEVKGGRISRDGRSNTWTSVDRHGTPHTISDPFDQARREMYSLIAITDQMPEWPSSPVRTVRAVALPDVIYTKAEAPHARPEIVIDRDDLDALEPRLREIVGWWVANEDELGAGSGLTTAAQSALIALLARSFTINSPLRLDVEEDERRIVQLTDEQFGLLDFLRHQRRALITGVAGSGKTLLAAEHAKRLARQGMNVLVVCVDLPLADHLHATIGQLPRVHVLTFDDLQHHLLRDAGMNILKMDENPEWQKRVLPELLLRAAQRLTEHYDALIVDEAQDILSAWWPALTALLSGQRDEIVYVFGDDNQDLYDIDDPDELGIVMPFELPRYELTQNRRNTKTIHDFAFKFYHRTDGGTLSALGPPGRPVAIREYGDVEDDLSMDQLSLAARRCRDELARVLHEIINVGKVDSKDVMILTPRTKSSWLTGIGAKRFAKSFELIPEELPDGHSAPPPGRQSQVRVANVNRFKGLDAMVVVLAELDGRIPANRLDTIIYIGATRARSHLAVIADSTRARLLRGGSPS